MADVADHEAHEIWMALNCGEPDGGCSCTTSPRPDGGYRGLDFTEIGALLGEHLTQALA